MVITFQNCPKAPARDDDIIIIETDTTTQKISLGSLIHYIKEHEEIAAALQNGNGISEAKAISSLIEHIASKATPHSFGHVKLSDIYQNTITNEEAAIGIGASQKALAEVYSVLNSNLGNCTFSVQSDGAYVTYTPEGGADAVTKKLGSGGKIKSQYLGSAPNYIYQSTPDGGRTYAASTTLPDSYIEKNLFIFAQGLNSKTSAAASPNLYLPYAGGQVSLSIHDGTFDPTQITRIGVTQLFIES